VAVVASEIANLTFAFPLSSLGELQFETPILGQQIGNSLLNEFVRFSTQIAACTYRSAKRALLFLRILTGRVFDDGKFVKSERVDSTPSSLMASAVKTTREGKGAIRGHISKSNL
jgi:hypothetical protein